MDVAKDLVGPDFEKADLVLFESGNVELTFPLPEHRSESKNYLAGQNLGIIPDDKWEVDSAGNQTYVLVKQTWSYDQAVTLDSVFSTDLVMVLMQVPEATQKKSIPLNKIAFTHWIIDLLKNSVFDMEDITPDDDLATQYLKNWQVPEQASDMDIIKKGNLDWIIASMGHTSMGLPEPMIFIPIDNQLLLMIHINSTKLSYSDREDTFQNEDIESVTKQIMMEFLEHIQITYSTEVLKQIKEQNALAEA